MLEGVRLTAGAGEMLQLTGANGAGKTSLLRTLCGLMQSEEGRVLWDHRRRAHEDLPAFHAQLVYLGHEPPLKADLTARENLHYWIGIRRPLSRGDAHWRTRRVGAGAWWEQPVRTLVRGATPPGGACRRPPGRTAVAAR